jgi:hypothetical protein
MLSCIYKRKINDYSANNYVNVTKKTYNLRKLKKMCVKPIGEQYTSKETKEKSVANFV